MKTKKTHTHRLCDIMFDAIIREWSIKAWRKLGDDLKQAIIAERVMFNFTGQDRDNIKSAEILDLYHAMLNFCGLGEDIEP